MALSLAGALSRQLTAKIFCPSLFQSNTLHDLTHRANPEPFQPIPHKVPNFDTADEAIKVVKSGDKVYVHSACATPLPLVDALVAAGRKGNLKNVEIIHILTAGPAHYNDEEFKGVFRSNNMFVGHNARAAVNEGRADYLPIFLSEIPLLFRRNIVQLDVALIQVSPPDQHGYCSLGISVDCTRAAIKNAKHIIGLANNNFPRTFGDSNIHYSHFDSLVHLDHPLPEVQESIPNEAEAKISKIIAQNLVDNGATIQFGIGKIPSHLCQQLKNHTDLGVHTELLIDGVVDLVDVGAVTNAQKTILTGKIAAGFAMGSAKLYNFVHNNPFVAMTAIEYVNNVNVIAQNPKVTAVNSCFEIDITGQVVSDSIGNYIYSGVGGQIDFLRGAASCKDGQGKPIIALPSTTAAGESRIVKFIRQGAGVVASRAHVHYLVTEYGIAYLFGKNLRQRAHALIKVAHPDHREALEKAAFERLNCMPSP